MAEKNTKTSKKSESRRQDSKSALAKTPSKVNSNKLELLVTIVPANKAEFYTDLLSFFEVNFQCTSLGHGTANADMWSISDFADQTKAVIFSVVKQEKVQDALAVLENKFATIKKGKGIAFTVPFSSVIGVATYGFLSNNKTIMENKQ